MLRIMTLPPLSSWCRRLLTVLALAALIPTGAAASVTLAARIDLPGTTGRLDHLAIDLDHQQLFVAALAANEVDVVDLKASKRDARLEGRREPQGVVFVPATQRLFVANGDGDSIEEFKSQHRETAIEQLSDADNLRLDTAHLHLYAGYSNGLAVVDTASLQVLERLPLPGHPEAFELALAGRQVYVNVPSVGAVVVLDRRTRKEIARWPIAPAAANFPMALDEPAHRLFIATRAPAGLQVFDTASGRRVAQQRLCSDADDLFIDTERRRLYAVCGEGRVDVIGLGEGDQYGSIQTVETSPGARTGLLVPALKELFVAAPAARGRLAAVLVYRID